MADTDIELSVKLDTRNISSSARDLRKEIQSIFDSSTGKQLDSRMQSLQATMAKTAAQSRNVAKEMQTLANQKIPTAEYKAAEDRVNGLAKALAQADEKWKTLEAVGAKQSAIQEWIDKANYFEDNLKEARAELQRIVESGRGFTLGSSTEEYANLVDKSRDLYNQMVVTVNKAYELDPALRESVRGVDGAERSLSGLPAAMERLAGSLPNKAMEAFNSILASTGNLLKSLAKKLITNIPLVKMLGKSADSSSKSFGKGFIQILKYAVGIRSLYFLFRKIRVAIKEGVDNLAQWHNGNNRLNESLSMLKSSLTQMKNAVGIVAASIINSIAPALNSLIQWITKVADAIARLLATISGAKTFIRAKSVTEDYAKSLNKTAGAAKKAHDNLLAIDELNVINPETGSGGGGGTDIENMFEEVPLEPIDLKQMLRDIDWDEIKAEAEEAGRKLARILNDIFADEELAYEIGNAIAQCINTAIHFAYGFVDELNWRQMGHWLGTLVKAGIENIEWDLLGITIGKALNGLADTVIGFFERYPVGLLGSSIARMFNRAIETIDPHKIGIALAEVLSAPIVEFTTFLKEADIATATQKVSKIIQEVLTGNLFTNNGQSTAQGKTLGNIIGEGIAAILNAAFDVVINADTLALVDAIEQFIEDILTSAVENIEWEDVLQGLANVGYAIVYAIFVKPVELIVALIAWCLKKLGEAISLVDEEAGQGLQNTAEKLAGVSDRIATSFKDGVDKINIGWDYLWDSMGESAESGSEKIGLTTAEIEEKLAELEKQTGTLSEAEREHYLSMASDYEEVKKSAENMSSGVTNAMASMAQGVAAGAQGAGLALGNVSTKIDETSTSVSDSANKMGTNVSTAIQNMGNSVSKTAGEDIPKYIDISKSKFDEGIVDVNNYDANTKTALSNVDSNAKAAEEAVQGLGETISTELDVATTTVDTWYHNIVDTYFSEAAWSGVFSDGLLASLATSLTKFTTTWKTAMTTWMADNDKLYWNKEVWTKKWNIIKSTYTTMWKTFSTTWDTNMTTWWTEGVEPFFKKEDWKKFGTNMSDGIKSGFEGIVANIANILNDIIDLFNTAMSNVAKEMNNLINQFNLSAATVGSSPISGVNWSNIGKVNVPALAEGAVIPPNKEFLAVLGDQTSGTNIEAPLSTIETAVSDVLRPYLERLIDITEDIYNKDTDVNVNIGDRDIAKAAIRGQKDLGLTIRTS